MRIAVASDHAGIQLRQFLSKSLQERLIQIEDLGPHTLESVDYPDFAFAVTQRILAKEADRGLLICGTGIGMAIAANKVSGIRAAVVSDPFSAKMAIEHNDAQILCLGQRVVGEGLALACLDAWLNTSFAGGRHQQRLDKLERRF